jgi:hypothetical protein
MVIMMVMTTVIVMVVVLLDADDGNGLYLLQRLDHHGSGTHTGTLLLC